MKNGDPYSEFGEPYGSPGGAVGGSETCSRVFTSVVVLRGEESAGHSLPHLRLDPSTFWLQVRLSNH